MVTSGHSAEAEVDPEVEVGLEAEVDLKVEADLGVEVGLEEEADPEKDIEEAGKTVEVGNEIRIIVERSHKENIVRLVQHERVMKGEKVLTKKISRNIRMRMKVQETLTCPLKMKPRIRALQRKTGGKVKIRKAQKRTGIPDITQVVDVTETMTGKDTENLTDIEVIEIDQDLTGR